VVELLPEQMSTLKVEQAGAGDNWRETAATGMISVDETQATRCSCPSRADHAGLCGSGRRCQRGPAAADAAHQRCGGCAQRAVWRRAQQASAASAARLAEENLKRQEAIYKTAGGALRTISRPAAMRWPPNPRCAAAKAALGAARDKLEIFGKTTGEIGKLENAHDVAGYHPETVFRAPIAGVIASARGVAGAVCAGGRQHAGADHRQPRPRVAGGATGRKRCAAVHLGDEVDVTVSAYPGRSFAVIDNIASALDPTSHRLPVRATIANPDGALKPQMFANFTIRHTSVPTAGKAVRCRPGRDPRGRRRPRVGAGPAPVRLGDVQVGDSHGGRVASPPA
jgi:cobalt-zinc-cadmium efflux system membrane fusion protein